jgi:membrane-associated protease RseP (regulator of RpoE activity)
VSSQDFSPEPYPLYAGEPSGPGAEGLNTLPFPRTRERYWLYALMFLATLLTTTIVGAAMQEDFFRNQAFDIEHTFTFFTYFWQDPVLLLQGLPFSLTLLMILLAHEFGHYLAAMYHGVDASLPYFLPSPFLGTFGAFIRVRSPIFSKRVLFDIGIAGPLAGFVFLLPALSIGLAFSKVIPGIANQGTLTFGAPLLQWLMGKAIFPGTPVSDIYLHPIARAAWIGMFTTALNLLPIGQLDGGHILYSFFPGRHKTVSKAVCVALLPLGKFWGGWLLWGLVLLWLGRRHPVVNDETGIGGGRRTLGWLALIVFLICFTYAPIRTGGL